MKKFLSLVLPTALLLFASGVQAADDSRVWVVFKPGQKASVKAQIQRAQGRIHYEFDNLNAIATTLPTAALNGIRNNPNIELVEDDPPRYPLGQTVPYGVDMVQARNVWDANRDGTIDSGAPTGSGIAVGVIDSGVYTVHEDFAGVAMSGYDGTGSAGGWNSDLCSHGTHVVGTIVAANNALGVVGVTPGKVSIYMVKVFGDDCSWSYSSSLVDAAQRCRDHGAKVISMSLGGPVKSRTEQRAFDSLYNKDGILSVAAAGNNGTSQTSYPASYNSVVSVAAVDQNGVVADFSQKNNQVELAAPGVGVLSTISFATSKVTVNGTDYPADEIEFAATGTASGSLVDGGKALSGNASWSGYVVLVERGNISFNDKVQNVQNSGGLAAVIYNNVPGGFSGTLGSGNSSTIPAVSITQEDGQTLLTKTSQSATVAVPASGTTGSGYAYYDGTSMATPHVSAVAALVWSANPSLSNAQIRDALRQTAMDLGPSGKDTSYGYGLVQAKAALDYLGYSSGASAPLVTITSPANGSTFLSGETISFAGTATDDSGADISSSLVWTANGPQIGSGDSFYATLGDGSYTIVASATDSNGTGSDSIAITVGSSTPPAAGKLDVWVETDKGTYTKNETATILVLVSDQDTSDGVSGANVHLELATPKGNLLAGDATTITGGWATFTYKVNTGRDGTGTYNVTVTATASGYESGTGSTTFEAQ